ncbi:MAG TPA: class I SAM-dependent methyltransferase, partial [Candidatus Paceibacterota bacterium]
MKEEMYDIMYQTERDHWWYRVRRELVSRLLGQIQKKRGGTPLHILDVGCGTGLLMQEMQQFGQIEGVDMSERAVAYCRERNLNPVVGSADSLPFPDGSFDVVVMLDVLEHLEDDSIGAREIYRILKPGGIAIVTVPAFMFLWGDTDEIGNRYRRYSRTQLLSRLREAGLQIDRSTYFNTLLFPA